MERGLDQNVAHSDEGFIGRTEAAKLIGVSPATLTSWRNRRGDDGPPCYRISPTHYVYKRSELIAWVEQYRVGVTIQPKNPGDAPRPWE